VTRDPVDPIAHVVHDAVRAWRAESGRKMPPVWERARKDKVAARISVEAVLSGAPVHAVHSLRAGAGVTPHWDQASEAERQESAMVTAIAKSLGCGVERWAVKTGTDPEAANVTMTAKQSTIAELIAFPAPDQPVSRVADEPECQVYTIEATVTAAKMEADSDYHLALADDQGNTMIAEAACPGCCSGSPWLDQIKAARSAVEQAIPALASPQMKLAAASSTGASYQDVNLKAKITGVGFFDRIHGQRGVAPNGIELHPVLDISFGGSA
jgi:hypothetical protein